MSIPQSVAVLMAADQVWASMVIYGRPDAFGMGSVVWGKYECIIRT